MYGSKSVLKILGTVYRVLTYASMLKHETRYSIEGRGKTRYIRTYIPTSPHITVIGRRGHLGISSWRLSVTVELHNDDDVEP